MARNSKCSALKYATTPAVALVAVLAGAAAAQQNKNSVRVPDGLALSEFAGYEKWQVIAVSQGSNIIDVIGGNPEMIAAYQSGLPAEGKTFPDGVKMVKIHWNATKQQDDFPRSCRMRCTISIPW